MGKKRIIPCLDIKGGKVVKGINFIGIREIGDPVEYALEYAGQDADEIVFLNIDASKDGKKEMIRLIEETVKIVSVPLIAGGGINCIEDIRELLQAGAKKVSINSAAVNRPELLKEAATVFGKERIVLAIDGKCTGRNQYRVMTGGGKIDSGMELVHWAIEGEALGAGEILLTSMDADGVKSGFDIPMLNAVCNSVKIPVIASGGCGTIGHFVKVFRETECDAALAASIFHYKDLSVNVVKKTLRDCGIPVETAKEGECA